MIFRVWSTVPRSSYWMVLPSSRVRVRRTAMLGGSATTFAWIVVVTTQTTAWAIGFPWLGVGLAYYFWQRRQKDSRPVSGITTGN